MRVLNCFTKEILGCTISDRDNGVGDAPVESQVAVRGADSVHQCSHTGRLQHNDIRWSCVPDRIVLVDRVNLRTTTKTCHQFCLRLSVFLILN